MDFGFTSEGRCTKFYWSPQFGRYVGFFIFESAFYVAYLYGMSFSHACASPFWIPDTVLLCALLLSRPRDWWIYILGALPIRLFSPIARDTPAWFLLATFVIDSAKGLALAALLRRFLRDPLRLGSLKDFILFGSFAVLLVPAASAFAGAWVIHLRGGSHYWPEWEEWFMGDATTHLVVTPIVLCWLSIAREKAKSLHRKPRREAALLAAGLIVTSYLSFGSNMSGADFPATCVYAPIPLLFWAAIRFEMAGASGTMAILTFFAVNAAIHSQGAFAGKSPADTSLILQQFLLFRSLPLYLVAILIQEKEDAEHSLRESEQRFRMVADSAPVLIWMSGTDKLCNFFNRGWLEFTGRTMEQELGIGWAEDIHRDDVRRCVKIYYTCFDAREPFEMEYRLRRYDGEYRWVLDRGVPRRDTNGNFMGYVGVTVDLTDRRRAEEARQSLMHASRLAVAGEFTAMVVHELNQPLNAILLNVAVLETLLDTKITPSDEAHEITADIRSDTLRASEAIRRIRNLVSKQEMEMQLVDLNATVSEVVRLAKSDALRRGVQLSSDCHAPSATVRGDAVHLQRVVLNLLLNGMDAVKENPESERHLFVSTAHNGDGFIEVSVKDNGQGVEPGNLSRIFDSFFTTKPDGMGIGLSMARSIVQMHSGRLWAENNRDSRGTTFRFSLPVAATEPKTEHPTGEAQISKRA
jgi:PAS domain S-box-containing protein